MSLINSISEPIMKFEGDAVDLAKFGTTAVKGTLDNLVDTAGVTITNNVGDILHSGRFLAKNTIGAYDNTQDNLFQFLSDVRVDFVNTIQLAGIGFAVGIAALFILYGDEIFEGGIKLGKIKLL